MSRYILHASMETNNTHAICPEETEKEILHRINYCKKNWKNPKFKIFDREEKKYFTEEEFLNPTQLTLF